MDTVTSLDGAGQRADTAPVWPRRAAAPNSEQAALEALRERFPIFTLSRRGTLWVANPKHDQLDIAPTIVDDTLKGFVRQLENPPARAGRPFTHVRDQRRGGHHGPRP